MATGFPSAPPERHYRKEHRDATQRMLLDEVKTRPRPTRRRTVAAAASAGAILLGTGTVVAYQLASSTPVTDKTTARCYSVVSTDFGKDFPGGTVAAVGTSSTGAAGTVTAPIGLCRYLWSTGRLGPVNAPGGTTSTSAPTAAQDLPLIGCVLPDGTAAVFPGTEQTCQELGLPVAQSG